MSNSWRDESDIFRFVSGHPSDAAPSTRRDELRAFIFLAWLAFMGTPLWGGLVISLFYAVAVFRWV